MKRTYGEILSQIRNAYDDIEKNIKHLGKPGWIAIGDLQFWTDELKREAKR